jgi:hypothetical protein
MHGACEKQREKVKKARIQREYTRGHSSGRTDGIHLAQEDHCSQLFFLLLLEIGSTFQKFVSGIMNNHGLVEVKQH